MSDWLSQKIDQSAVFYASYGQSAKELEKYAPKNRSENNK